MTSFRLRIMAQVLPFLLITPGLALAQAPPTRGQATAALNAAPNPAAAQYTRQQIDQMVAPIALYPDQLLGQVLMAATYPPQLVEAAQWLDDPKNADLKDDAMVAALDPLPWDPSVKALIVFPQVIAMMTEHIDWTQALGVAFATQQAEIMNRVQALRQLAVKSGQINKMKQVSVRREGPAIVIASAQPDRVFVPVYNPTIVYGQWPHPQYQPVYLPPPRRYAEARGVVVETIGPGVQVYGYRVVQPLWGWSRPDWRTQRITVNTVEYTRITRDVRVGPNNTWRRQGPVVLVAPSAAPRSAPAAVAIPAGTVAPGAAVAVVQLPQRAARQPDVIRVATPSAQPSPAAPAAAPTSTAQPSPVPTSPVPPVATPTPTPTAQPIPVPPAATPRPTAQPTPTPPAATPTTTARPSPTTPTATPTPTAQPSPAQPGSGKPAQTQATTAPPASPPTGTQADKPRPAGNRASEDPPGNRQTTTTAPGRPQGTATAPAIPSREPGAASRAANPAETAAKPVPDSAAPTPPPGPRGRGPDAAEARPATGPRSAPTAAPERPGGPGGAQPPATLASPPQSAPRGPERGNQRSPSEAQNPGAAEPPAAARRGAAPPDTGAQGTSAPAANAGPPAARRERPQDGAGPRPGGRPDDGDKKDR